jgi:hypothetical protein
MLSGGTLESGGNVNAGETGAASPDLRAASESSVSPVSTRTAWLPVGDNIDVERVDLDPATDAPSGLGNDRGRPEPRNGSVVFLYER